MGEQGASQTGAKTGDCGGVANCGIEKFLQAMMRALSSKMVMRFSGHGSKIMERISFRSSESGRIVFRKLRFLVKAVYVESSLEACFHGLRPHVRLTRITPRDQMSFGAH